MRPAPALACVLAALIAACSSVPPAPPPETTVALNQGTTFTATDGSPALVEPGTYAVAEGPDRTIRLRSASGRSIDVLALETTHGTNVDGPQAVFLEETEEVRRVVLLMPDRQSLEAWGSTSGVRARGGGGDVVLEERLARLIAERRTLKQEVKDAHELVQNVLSLSAVMPDPTAEQPEFREACKALATALAAAQIDASGTVVIDPALENALENAFEQYLITSPEADIPGVITNTLGGALYEAESQVRDLAQQLRAKLQAMAGIRSDIAELREIIEGGAYPETIEVTDADGNKVIVTVTSPDEAEILLREREHALDTMFDFTPQLQQDVQDAMNDMDQAYQVLSSIMKSKHETAKSILQNMR